MNWETHYLTSFFVVIGLIVVACSEEHTANRAPENTTANTSPTSNMPAESVDEQDSTTELLIGKITSSSGEILAGVPVRARRANSNIAVIVYTNSLGEYSFPEWSDLTPGSYSVNIGLAEYEPVNMPVVLSTGKTTRLDFSLHSREPSIMDATARDIVMGLPGTDEQKHLLIQCSNCHSLQWALRKERSRQEWDAVVRRMLGPEAASGNTPGTRSMQQQRYIEPLVDYLTEIRGPDSSDKEIPFKLQPRPTDDASTRLVVTEYDIPRGGKDNEWPFIIRGDYRYAWPHDVIVDDKYVYYTDHFSFNMGRLDKATGEVKEFAYVGGVNKVIREDDSGRVRREQGAHDIKLDSQGRVLMGMDNHIVRFDPNTEEFTLMTPGAGTFALDPNDNVLVKDDDNQGLISRLDTRTGLVTEYKTPPLHVYDLEADSQGRAILNGWGHGVIRVFDYENEETYTDYPTPTPASGPRRGKVDSQDRLWVALYWAGMLAVFDPDTGVIKEYPLIPGTEPFGPPFPSPYSTTVDDRNQIVWTNDFNSDRIYMFDINTEKMTEFMTPERYEIRDLGMDRYSERPTMWIPDYRPTSKIVKVQLR